MIYILYPCSPSSHFGAYQQAETMAEARAKISMSGIKPELVTLLDDKKAPIKSSIHGCKAG